MNYVHFDEALIMRDIEAMVTEAEAKADPAIARALRSVLVPFHRWHVREANQGVTSEEVETAVILLITNMIGTHLGSMAEEPRHLDPSDVARLMTRIVVELQNCNDAENAILHHPVPGGHA